MASVEQKRDEDVTRYEQMVKAATEAYVSVVTLTKPAADS